MIYEVETKNIIDGSHVTPICKIDTSAFMRVLPVMKKATANSTFDILTSVKLVTKEDEVSIKATNLNAVVEWKPNIGTDVIVYEEGCCLINLYNFAKQVNKVRITSSGELTIYRTEDGCIVWKIGEFIYKESERRIVNEWPDLLETPDNLDWINVNIDDVIKYCSYATDNEGYIDVFASIVMTKTGFLSTDGHRLSIYKTDIWKGRNILIPNGKSRQLPLSALKECRFDSIACQNSKVYIRSQYNNLIVRFNEVSEEYQKYPDFSKLFQSPCFYITIKRNVFDHLKSMKIKDGVGRINITDGKLIVHSNRNKEEANIMFDVESIPVVVCLDPAYVVEALTPIFSDKKVEECKIGIVDEDSPVFISHGDKYEAFIMTMLPIR